MNRRDFFKKIAGIASAAVVGTVASKAAVPAVSDEWFTVEISNMLPPSGGLYNLGSGYIELTYDQPLQLSNALLSTDVPALARLVDPKYTIDWDAVELDSVIEVHDEWVI